LPIHGEKVPFEDVEGELGGKNIALTLYIINKG